jgi:hypothetical protein
MDLFSPNNHNLKVNDVKISLIPPTSEREIYSLIYAGTPIMKSEDRDAELKYEIKKIFSK